jgi:thioredoxin 1
MRKFLFFVPVLVFYLTACSQYPEIEQINSSQFQKLITEGDGTLLDVRTLHEFKNGHIKNAGQLNYYAVDFKQKLLLLPKNEAVYLYCNTGYRSKRAAKILMKNGFTRVYNLEHGIMEWNFTKRSVIVEPDAKPDSDNKYDLAQFQSLINSGKLVFVDFYAPWCAPCRKMMPMMDSLKVEYHDRIDLVKINADASKKLMKDLEIISVPYLVMYWRGEILFSRTGIASKEELRKLFENQINMKN